MGHTLAEIDLASVQNVLLIYSYIYLMSQNENFLLWECDIEANSNALKFAQSSCYHSEEETTIHERLACELSPSR